MNGKVYQARPRREFLRQLAACFPVLASAAEEGAPPVRAITRGPNYHWFGYYDKLQFDPASRFVLGNEVGFEHRSPRPGDVIKVGMVDLETPAAFSECARHMYISDKVPGIAGG